MCRKKGKFVRGDGGFWQKNAAPSQTERPFLKVFGFGYIRGGLGDGVCKKFLINVLEEELAPIRAERAKWEADIDAVYDIIREGTERAVEKTNATLARVRKAMKIDYFEDRSIVKEWNDLLKQANQ